MKRILKRPFLVISVAAGVGIMTNAHATNGYELIGIGGYQMGMAGAVVAAPGTAMTAITNPAGLAEVAPAADSAWKLSCLTGMLILPQGVGRK